MKESERDERPLDGMVGVKKSDIISPKEAFGREVGRDELPEGVQCYMRRSAANFGGPVVVRVYDLVRVPGGTKYRKDFVDKLDYIPDEDEICIKYGPNGPDSDGYRWMAEWTNGNGSEVGMMSEVVKVGERWREKHEEYKRAAAAKSRQAGASPVAAAAPALPDAGFGSEGIIRIMTEARRSAFSEFESMAKIMKANQPEPPTAALDKMYEAIGRMGEKLVESQMGMLKRVSRVAEDRAVRELEDDGNGDGEEDGEGEDGFMGAVGAGDGGNIQALIRPFMPLIERFIGPLIGGGPVGNFVKDQVLSSREWQEVTGDKDTFEQVIKVMRDRFGDDKTQKALAVLNAVEKPKAEPDAAPAGVKTAAKKKVKR